MRLGYKQVGAEILLPHFDKPWVGSVLTLRMPEKKYRTPS